MVEEIDRRRTAVGAGADVEDGEGSRQEGVQPPRGAQHHKLARSYGLGAERAFGGQQMIAPAQFPVVNDTDPMHQEVPSATRVRWCSWREHTPKVPSSIAPARSQMALTIASAPQMVVV